MTVTVDINVLLDVFLARPSHFQYSSAVVDLISKKILRGVCPSHGLTTIYYLLRRSKGPQGAIQAVDRLLADFEITGLQHDGWVQARRLAFRDFEDSAVSQVAVVTGSQWLITRNTVDFAASPVPAIEPRDFLNRWLPPLDTEE